MSKRFLPLLLLLHQNTPYARFLEIYRPASAYSVIPSRAVFRKAGDCTLRPVVVLIPDEGKRILRRLGQRRKTGLFLRFGYGG